METRYKVILNTNNAFVIIDLKEDNKEICICSSIGTVMVCIKALEAMERWKRFVEAIS